MSDSLSHRWNVAHRLTKRPLLLAVNSIAALSIFFFGYDQGMMSGVNNSKDYIYLMGFGHTEGPNNSPVVDNTILQGGIVSIYYLGTLIGALGGGWFGDKVGRVKAIAAGAAWAIFGAALQCSAQNKEWMICARLINGFGTGILNAIVPIWSTETSEQSSRGAFIAIEFTLNIFGVVVAYWLEFGLSFINNGESPFRWRFPIGFQIIPLLALFISVWFFPESPRWLVKSGRREEARWVLGRLRGDQDAADIQRAEVEYQEIVTVAEEEASAGYAANYWTLITGIGTGDLHVGRRVQLVVWLQIIQEWAGIAGVTVYAPTIFKMAGYDDFKSQWLSGLNNVFYMLATMLPIFTLDIIGRRWSLWWGAAAQAIAMFLAGGMTRATANATAAGDLDKVSQYGAASAAFIFIFTAVFGMNWLVVPWLYPAEIFPLAMRARGNALGVVGWSIGNGWLTLLCPPMFSNIAEKTFYVFGAANILAIILVWAFYPESNHRTLEDMDMLFASKSPFAWDAEKRFHELKAQRNTISVGDLRKGPDDEENEFVETVK